MDLFTYLMAKNGHNTSIHEDLFSYLLGKSQGGGGEIKTATGVTIYIPDAKKLVSFMMTKESTQETTTGKNLLKPITSRTTQKNGIVFTYDEETQIYTFDGTCTSDDTSFPIMSNTINFENGITKIFAYFIDGSAESSCEVQFFQSNYSAGESLSVISLNQQNPVVSKTSGHTGNYLSSTSRVKFRNGSVVNNFKIKIMVTNDDDTTYEPYTNGASPNPDYPQEVKTVKGSVDVYVSNGETTNTYTINLGNNELVGIGDYKDELLVDKSGNVFINKKIGKVVLDGSENNWENYEADISGYFVYRLRNNQFANAIRNSQSLCNMFGWSINGNIKSTINKFRITEYSSVQRFYCNTNVASTVADFKTWLSTHNIEVYYALETPELIDLQTTVDIKLFKGVNNISNSENGYMTIEYVSEEEA